MLDDAGTGPAPGLVRINVQSPPVPSLAAFAPTLVVEQVRVILSRPDPSQDGSITLADRTFPFDVNSNQLSASLTLAVTTAETLNLDLEYQTALGVTLFVTSGTVDARPGVTANATLLGAPAYLGPGASIAALTITPADSTMVGGDSVQFDVTAIDSAQQPVTTFYVKWTVSGIPGATLNANGLFRAPAATGQALVTATTPTGVSVSTGIVVLSGGLQIIPDSVERLPGGTQQFTVGLGGTRGATYIWSVNGTDGGSATFGTIDTSGFYVAPTAVPSNPRVSVCARDSQNANSTGCAVVIINPIPSAGADVIVVNDMNLFDNGFIQNPNNKLFAANLVNYQAVGSRNNGTVVMYDRGRNSSCFADQECADPAQTTLDSVITANGFSLSKVDTLAAWDNIPANVKVIFLWNPTVPYTRNDINGFKAFASQGGRIVFLGEHVGFYGQVGIDTENQFLTDMGAQFTNIGAVLACQETIPASAISQHQVTTGLTDITIACASEARPGPNDFPLFLESTGLAVAGVAKISTIPLPAPPSAAARPAGRVQPYQAPRVDGRGRPIRSND